MVTEKINIVLDELNQRRDEILDFRVADNDWITYPNQAKYFIQRVSEFVFYIHSIPELKEVFERLLYLPIRQMESEEWKQLSSRADDIIVSIGQKIRAVVNSSSFTISPEENNVGWIDPFGDHLELTSLQLIAAFSNHTKPSAYEVEKLGSILSILIGDFGLPENSIFYKMGNFDSSLKSEVMPFIQELREIHEKLKVFGEYEPNYYGYQEAKILMGLHRAYFPETSPTEQFIREFHDAVPLLLRKNLDKLSKDMILQARQAALRITRILSRSLLLRKSKRYTITRCRVYLEWMSREKSKHVNENSLLEEMARFLFSQGQFPYIRFNLAPKQPDLKTGAQGDEILIEAKYYRKHRTISSDLLDGDISQAVEYHRLLKAEHPDFSNEVFLIVFYDHDFPLRIQKNPIMTNGVSVFVEFIYVGKKPTSKRKPHRDITPQKYMKIEESQ